MSEGGRAVSLASVGMFWRQAAAEVQPICTELAQTYRDAGAAGIMEQRAVALGVFVSYIEGILAAQPARLGELAAIYTRLAEAERRAWQAERAMRSARRVGAPDLAGMAGTGWDANTE